MTGFRHTPLGRLVSLPICILASAWSFLTLFWTKDPEERGRRENLFHWLDDLPEPRKAGSWSHWYKNRLTEYLRAHSQTAAKVGSFVVVVLAGVAAIGWWA